jgi:hypothetical protein
VVVEDGLELWKSTKRKLFNEATTLVVVEDDPAAEYPEHREDLFNEATTLVVVEDGRSLKHYDCPHLRSRLREP